jgi:imidazolonepropionase-like amidohydrolase
LVQVLAGELPWCHHVHRADDLDTAIRQAGEFGCRLVINHGTEAHLTAERIALQGIPVISGPLMGGRSKTELRLRTLPTPACCGPRGHVVFPSRHVALRGAV